MQRLLLLTSASLAWLSSCAPPETALKVTVTVRAAGAARVRADCLRLTVSDDTQELKSITIKRPTDDGAVFAVRRGSDLPGTVKVQATGFLGPNCGDDASLKLNAQGEVVTGVFPESGVGELAVFLDPANASLDADRDGFVAAVRGGLDCKDDDNTVFPGASQVCSNTSDTDCDQLTGCDDTECGTALVCADPPDRVQINTLVATMLRHECRGPFQVMLRNAMGERDAIRDTPVALAASLPGVTVHGVSNCNDLPILTLPIRYGQRSFEVYLKADNGAFGLNTLTATAAGVATPGTAMVEVHPQPIDHLDFTSPTRTVSAGQCSTESVTLEFRDAMNRRTDVDAPTTVTLASAPGDLNNANIFFSDAVCTADGSMQQLQPGQGTVSLHLRAGRAGSFTLTATPSAGTGSTQPLTVQPGAAAKLAFTNGPIVLSSTEGCSMGRFTVELQDAFDNPVVAAADFPVRVSVTGLVGVSLFEESSNCNGAPQTDFVIPAGQRSVVLRARGTNASTPEGEIQASVLNGSAVAMATQVLRISAGTATRFVLTGSPQSPLASVCSANPFSVQLLDAANNPASSPTPVTITLSTTPASDSSFRFYSGAGCATDLANTITVPPGQTSATFYYRGNRAVSSFEIRGSGPLTAPATFLPGNSIRPGVPGKIQFAPPPSQTTQAGTCTPTAYVANVLDLFDNATSFSSPQTVTVGSNPAGVTVGASTCATGNSVPLAAGSTSVSFTAMHTVTSSYALTATVNGFSTAMPVTMIITPGLPLLIADTPAMGNATLAAGQCQTITLSRRDMYGNNAPTSGATAVNLVFPPSTTFIVYSSNNCGTGANAPIAMNSAHTVTFSVSPRTAGNHSFTASVGAQSALFNFQVSAGPPTLVFETPNTGTGMASATQTVGGCTPVTVARKDMYGNDVPIGGAGGSLTFTLPAGTTAHTASPCLAGNATTSIPVSATEARANFFVSAARSSPTGGQAMQSIVAALAAQTATLTLTVNPGAPNLILAAPAATTSIVADQCLTVTLERRDSLGNLVPVTATNAAVTVSPAGLTLSSGINCTGAPPISVAQGTSARSFSLKTTVSSAPVVYTFSLDGQTVPMTLTVNPGPLSAFQVLGLPGSGVAVSGSCIGPLTIRRRDAFNNDVTSGAASVALSSPQFSFSTVANSCAGATSNLMVNIADQSANSAPFYATATAAGMATMTATAGSITGAGTLTINAGPPNQLAFNTMPRTFTAGICGGAGNVITVQLRDAAGNPTNAPGGGTPFTAVSSSGMAAAWHTNAMCTAVATGGNFTIPAGSNSVSLFYRDNTVGSPSVSLTSALVDPPAQVHSVVLGPAARLSFTTSTRTFTAAECPGSANVITVQLEDTVGNPVPAGPGGQTFTAASTSMGPIAWFTDALCGSASATGAFTIPQDSSTVSIFYRDARAGTPSISLSNGSGLMNPVAQGQTVIVGPPTHLAFTSNPQTLPALGCSGLATVRLEDLGGNAVNTTVNRTITFSAAPLAANTTFYSNNNCTNALASNQLPLNSGSSVSMYFRAENPDTVTLTAATAGLDPATQVATIGPAAAASLVIVTAPTTVEAGFCLPVVIERQDTMNRPATPLSVTTITPTLAPATGAQLFGDSTCATALGSTFTIASGLSSATIWMKGVSGSLSGVVPGNQVYTLTATSSPMSDNVAITVQPMVRRRPSTACTLANSSATVVCPIVPTLSDISRTMLFFQATPDSGDDAGDDNVTCLLRLNGSSAAEVFCERNGTTNNVPIEWQTVSFPYSFANGGVSVQHLTAGCTTAELSAMPIDVTTNAPVNNSFVLFSNRTSGSNNDGEHFFTAQLTSNTSLRFSQSTAGSVCTRGVDFAAQVVSWAGAFVTHGLQTGGSTSPFTATLPMANSAPAFLLYSSRMTGDTSPAPPATAICRRRLRGEITNSTTMTFSRGCNGADIQDIAWEHVRLPAGTVQQVTGTTGSGSATIGVTLGTAVDLTRSVAFFGGQGQGGSASGNTTYTATDRVGAALARPLFTSSTALNYTRGANGLVGAFTGYVVQFAP